MEKVKQFIGFNPDFIGSVAALVCAVHCMAFPVLLSIGLVSNASHNHAFDFVFLLVGLGIAGYVLAKDYLKHRNVQPLVIAIIGFIVLYIGIESHGKYFLLNVLGGVMITVSHFINWRLSH